MVPKLSNDLHACLQSFARFCQICMNTFEKGYKQCEKQEVLLIPNSVSPFFLFFTMTAFYLSKKRTIHKDVCNFFLFFERKTDFYKYPRPQFLKNRFLPYFGAYLNDKVEKI